MGRTRRVESHRDRMEVATEAGLGRISFVSVLAGMLVCFGAFGVVAAVTAAVLNAVGVDTGELTRNDWRDLGIGGAVVTGLVLFLSWFFGGYVAGRMSRRAGSLNGLMVFVLGILVAAGIGAAVGTQADASAIQDNLRSFGVPTSGEEWSELGTIAGLACIAAMFLGSWLGGAAGERWHGKLAARAADPSIGPNAETDEQRRPEVDLRDERPTTVDTDSDNVVGAGGGNGGWRRIKS
jgi:hypothetical protein